MDDIIGLSIEEAERKTGKIIRAIEIDGEKVNITLEANNNRINVVLSKGIIVAVKGIY